MTYPVNPNDPTTPTNDQGATQGAEELRAIKALMAGLVVVSLAAPSVRQAVQSATLDTNGYNNALTVGAGLRPGLSATATPYHLSAAAGFAVGKPLDTNESILVDIADILGVDLPLNNTSFLYRNIGASFGSTLVPPQYGYTFDRTRGALLNFEGINGAVTTTDDFGNTWILTGATISTAQFKFGASSLDCTGGGAKSARSVNFTTLGDGSWEMSAWFRFNALPGVGVNATLIKASNAAGFGFELFVNNTAGTVKLTINASADGTTQGIANTVLGANTVWALNQWNKIRCVFDALSGTYKVYLSLNGAVETADISVASGFRICNLTELELGRNVVAGANQFDGWIDAFRFIQAATNTTTEVPAVIASIITDYKYNFFSIPQMKMFEVTTASAVASVNPTLTAVVRLFLGEADTSGVAVTAIRNYAIRGEYIGPWTVIPAVITTSSFNANLGTIEATGKLQIRFTFATFGFQIFDILDAGIYGGSGTDPVNMHPILTRNTLSFTTGAANPTTITARSNGLASAATSPHQFRLSVKRSF